MELVSGCETSQELGVSTRLGSSKGRLVDEGRGLLLRFLNPFVGKSSSDTEYHGS